MSEDGLNSPRAVIEEYVDACREGDGGRLQAIFHPNALMAGFYEGEYYMGSPAPFYDEVAENPAPARTGLSYAGIITTVESKGNVASVALEEKGFLGASFTNWFHLVKLDGAWTIICKSYQDG